MAENGSFDPMVLESRLHYYPKTLVKTPVVVEAEANVVEEDPCMEITVAGALGNSALDRSQSPEQGVGTGTQVGEEHGPGTLTQLIGNGRTILDREQEAEGPPLNPPSEASRKRNLNWGEQETNLLLAAEIAFEKNKKTQNRLNNEPKWDGVAKGLPGRTGEECRRRVETVKKCYKTAKEYCEKEKKEFADLNEADFAKMKLASKFKESWYNLIRDSCVLRPAKRSRAHGPGSCSTSGNSGVVSTNVATASGPPRISQITASPKMVARLHPTGAAEDESRSSSAAVEPHPEVPRASSDVDDKIHVYEHSGVTFIKYPWPRGCE